MNATIGSGSNNSWSYLGTNNDDRQTNDSGARLLSLSEECNLYIMNYLYESKPIDRHTWYSLTGRKESTIYSLSGI